MCSLHPLSLWASLGLALTAAVPQAQELPASWRPPASSASAASAAPGVDPLLPPPARSTATAASVAAAAPAPAAHEQVWITVADARLDQMRGGFDVGGGLIVSLGIAQATYINGQLVTQTVIPQAQLSQLSTAQATLLRDRLNTLTVVQNGPGNRYGNIQSPANGSAQVSQVAGAGPGTVIQNSLNGQHIQQLTTIDASSNALGLIRAGNWQATLRDSMGAVGGIR